MKCKNCYWYDRYYMDCEVTGEVVNPEDECSNTGDPNESSGNADNVINP